MGLKAEMMELIGWLLSLRYPKQHRETFRFYCELAQWQEAKYSLRWTLRWALHLFEEYEYPGYANVKGPLGRRE